MAQRLPVDIYIRVSRVGGREHLTSPAEQEREGRAHAERRGLQVGKILTDIDQSGGTLDRPGLQEALQRIEARESGGIVVAYLSRATRDTIQGLQLLDRIRGAGGDVYAPNLPSDYITADGRMLTTIQLAIDTGYRQRKAEEFERAKEAAIERGIPVHGRPPVGLRQREDRRLEPDPEVAPVIRELFVLRGAGAGPVELAQLLEKHGIKTSQGSTFWSKPAIYNLIRNRIYVGELHYGRDDRYVNLTAVEPIVDIATWIAAQHPNGRRIGPVSETSSWLLTGIVRCFHCRYALQGTTTSRGKRIYRCNRRHSGGICPTPARVDADLVETAAEEEFWRLTADVHARGDEPPQHDDLPALEEAFARADTDFKQYMSPAVQAAVGDTDEWAAGLRERRETRERAASALAEARARHDTPTPALAVASLREAWEHMTIVDRRGFMSDRFDAIALRRDPLTMIIFPAGTAPELPRRGFKTEPVLAPFDTPLQARTIRLQP